MIRLVVMRTTFVSVSLCCASVLFSCHSPVRTPGPHTNSSRSTLAITCVDADTKQILPAWAIVKRADGTRVEPNDDPRLFVVSENAFLFEKRYKLAVPEDQVTVIVEKGFDFEVGAWGANPGNPADINGDDAVDAADLALLLGAWGPCE